MGQFPAINREGPPVRGWVAWPSQAGQAPTWNTDGTFAGWKTIGVPSPLNLISASASQTPLSIQAAAGQTANLFEIRDSAAAVTTRFNASGQLSVLSTTNGVGVLSRHPTTGNDGFSSFQAQGLSGAVYHDFRTWGAGIGGPAVYPTRLVVYGTIQANNLSLLGGHKNLDTSGGRFTITNPDVVAFQSDLSSDNWYASFRSIRSVIGVHMWDDNFGDHQLTVKNGGTNRVVLALRSISSQSADILQAQADNGTVLSAIDKLGAWRPAQIADANAVNGTLYFSSTVGKLVFKDASGIVNSLY